MSVIQFIPNQPIRFESDTQYCKNRDDQAYAALMQEDDTMCIQWKQDWENYFEADNIDLWAAMPLLNGTFTGNATGWTLGTGWTYGSNKVTHAAGNSSAISQSLPFRTGGSYRITFTVSGRTAGSINIILGVGAGSSSGTVRSTNATFSEVVDFNDDEADNYFGLLCTADFDGSIDDVTVESIPYDNTDMTYWETTNTSTDPITHLTGNVIPLQTHGLGLTSGHHSVVYTITNSTAGTVTLTVSGQTLEASTGNGTFIRYFDISSVESEDNDGEIHILPSTDFDGDVNMTVRVYEYNTSHVVYIYDTEYNQISDAYNNESASYPLVYEDDRITWCFKLSDLEYSAAPILLTNGCYFVRITDGSDATDFDSSLISYRQSWGACTQMVVGINDSTYADGFNWTTFTLRQRLRTLRISPKYPSSSDTYIYSTGRRKRTFSQSEKTYTWWLDKVDEYTHDVVRLQILCDTFTIDGVEYFCVQDGYEPEWAENMKRNLSRSRVEIQKQNTVLYNRNC